MTAVAEGPAMAGAGKPGAGTEPSPQALADDVPSQRWFAGPAGLWLLVGLMAVTGATLALPSLVRFAGEGVPGLQWWLLVPLFGLTETLVIHLPTLRNAHSHTLREVPAVAGLAFLAPGEYVAAYVIGSGVALVVARRQRGIKLAFNVSMFTLEAALGVLVYQTILGSAQPFELRGWAAAFGAVVVTDLVSAVAVTTAITLSEKTFDRGVLQEALGRGLVAAFVNTCMALLVVVLVVKEPPALPLVGVMLAVLIWAYRAYVELSAGYSRLHRLYDFVGSTERPADFDQAVEAVLADARRVLRSDRGQLVVLPLGAEPGIRFVMDAAGELTRHRYLGASTSDAWWAPAALGQTVLHNDGARPTSQWGEPSRLGQDRPRDGLAAPLQTEGQVSAVLLVSDHAFEGQTFSGEDLHLFETLAAHAAVALDKARLVDRLRRVAAEREQEARHDSLTGLPNRRAFQEAVTELMASGDTGAVLFLDLDDFKDVNDTLGHDAGDTLLQKTGEHLQAACPGMVARFGGDEFAVLLRGVSADEALGHARNVHAAAATPVSLGTFTMVSHVSIGVAMLRAGRDDANEVLRQADVAMYEAKGSGTGVEMYRPEHGRAVARKLVLATDLPATVDAHEFSLCFQPQADAGTGRVVGAEALVRWLHPTYGPVPPPEMVALAERVGHLRRLTDAILADALRQRSAWVDAGYELAISVNITALDLRDESLPDTVTRLLEETGTPAEALTLEITEQGVMEDPGRCVAVLDRLAEAGVQLSLDDFGTGYSSLAHLERLPVDEVKIDKSFVQRLEKEASDDTVIRSTITLAHDLGMRVVAEGLETRSAWQRVAGLGCEVVQGYTLARPLPAEETVAWLRDHFETTPLPLPQVHEAHPRLHTVTAARP
jgi:diguanylate cyclase (GGDEF)-like protein